ncbi:MAG: AIR synthase-related protein, partial [Candidatus Aenigmatarchaeota archaeon]
GPLALDLKYMHAIRYYFHQQGRNPTDVELESLAQTWSEHCVHTITTGEMDEIKDGLFKTFIKKATDEIRAKRGKDDFCRSVFEDNSGAIIFDDVYLITDKVETHNAPSALDPFGGAITGIVGVDRDAIGFGLGAKPILHRYGFCFGRSNDRRQLYRRKNKVQPVLLPGRIAEGVIAGVNSGGNCSGIPTPQGFIYLDDSYRGKPLVFVGTLGLIPQQSAGRDSCKKRARPDDHIIMIGGRVGKDGIHGATFSSEALDSGSPVTAVQIGDPITQKTMSDAVVKEARDRELYTSITDNGAGGLSCSVGEMAKESGGCDVELDNVPLKYHGLRADEIWISEAQERMTLSVPPEKLNEFLELMKSRDVEATTIGRFTDSGRCVVSHNEKTIMDVDLKFLHEGRPTRPMKTTFTRPTYKEPSIEVPENLTAQMHGMLARPNIASFEFISRQYDHEVQGGSVLKPLQGRGRVNGDATIVRPVLNSPKGVIISHGVNPAYSLIDTYNMAACAIDTAVRNAVSAGADPNYLALLDNFCWCSSNEPERLGQLRRAFQACYDYATAYGTPFISGKDSMFNDFIGYDGDNNPVKISVLPTLLASSVGVMQDASRAVSIDIKMPRDIVYVTGKTHDELGASEYFAMLGEQQRGERFVGNHVPAVNAEVNKRSYAKLANAISEGLVASAKSAHLGGLGVALAKTAMAGKLGMDASLVYLPGTASRDDFALFSESPGRVVVTVHKDYRNAFEDVMKGTPFAQIGVVKEEDSFDIRGRMSNNIVNAKVSQMLDSYRSTFGGY